MTPEKLARDGAKASLYAGGPPSEGASTATLGSLRFDSEAAGVALLDEAARRARADGRGALLAPLDGDTWHAYRAVTWSDGSVPFLLEPTSGPHDVAALQAAGFEPVAHYLSTIAALDDAIGAPAPRLDGVTVEPWDGADADALVDDLFALSTHAFANNPFFKPIDRKAFAALYRPLVPVLDPRHVLFARDDDGALLGYLFATPDFMAPDTDRPIILKTYAATRRGLGFLLADTFHRRARDLGFSRVIHALMHENNASRERSRLHGARVMRRYALFAKRLDGCFAP